MKLAALTIFAASSLAHVFPQIDSHPRYSFGGSDRLAHRIEQGAPADVFAAASPALPKRLFEKGLVERPVVFATDTLIVLVPRANLAGIHSVFDLRRRGLNLVIGKKGVPIGDHTRSVLRRLGLTGALRNVVSEERNASGIVGKVMLGQADAGIAYATDARPAAGKVSVIHIPARGQPAVRYELAVVRSTKHLAAARAFVRRVLSKAGGRLLHAAGFGLP